MTDEVHPDVAQRRYERWVMRAAELVWGDYPDDREEAERVLLVRMQEGLVGSVPPSDFLGEEESTLEEVGEYFSDYGEDHVQAARSLVSALHSAAGGEELSGRRDERRGGTLSVSVRGVSLDVEGVWVELTVDPNSFACRDASDLRALHERIARELPKRELTVEEAANEALEAVEEMQGMLEDVREVSEVLDTQEEMREVRVALENLWMMLAGIAAVEEDRRLKGEDGGSNKGEDGAPPAS
ncbi:MAG TPA: hypothetical protein VFE09_02090 [Rubrobacteraceae bacterium]|nr:hypothetical protein [Rubrobacteraceae bacterium]